MLARKSLFEVMSSSNTFYILSVAAMIQAVVSQEGFVSIGCYSDDPAARALHHFVGSSSNMTAESCFAQCSTIDGINVALFPYMLGGLEFGTECYCGNAILNYHEPINASSCNMPCAGNSSEICGGANAISMYTNGYADFTSGPAEIAPASPYEWLFYGCFEDSVTDRQIPHRQANAPEEMDVEICVEMCLAQNFLVAGLQFGQECYCGNVPLPPGIAAPNSSCNLQCTFNAHEFCGAANLNLVYYVPRIPGGCSLECPSGIVKQGKLLLLVSSVLGYYSLECAYYNEPNILAEACSYNPESGQLFVEPDGPDCEPYAETVC